MPVIKSGSRASHALDGIRFTPCSAPSAGGTELAVWIVDLEAGAAGTPHRLDREEVLHVLDGSLVIEVDGESAELTVGDTASVPAGALLSLRPRSARGRVLACTRAGLTATMSDGTTLQPPWAQ
jgi:mannose-6-phosphate isomerase-like protein (cupin superfamily)